MKANRITGKPYRPSENFRQWVAQVGPYRLAKAMEVTYRSVCRWVAVNTPQRPRFRHALDIVTLSHARPLRDHGPLILADVIGELEAKS